MTISTTPARGMMGSELSSTVIKIWEKSIFVMRNQQIHYHQVIATERTSDLGFPRNQRKSWQLQVAAVSGEHRMFTRPGGCDPRSDWWYPSWFTVQDDQESWCGDLTSASGIIFCDWPCPMSVAYIILYLDISDNISSITRNL